jgi:HD superfamily phosphohydrolase
MAFEVIGYEGQSTFWKKRIDDFVGYVIDVWERRPHGLDKEKFHINDPIHGTVTFEADEVKLINSPLLQRLKRISQMGFAAAAYPGANHTRFAHSLGTAYLAGRIFSEIQGITDENMRRAWRAARIGGLLHDIGQGPFSHVTDRLCEHFFEVGAGYGENRERPRAAPGMHEYFGLDILSSPKLQDFLSSRLSLDLYWLKAIPYAIVGYAKGKTSLELLVTQIVNGLFDADKLDYILRDSSYAGLPLPLDTERLVRMVELRTVQGEPRIRVKQKGARSLDVLYRGRAFLFPTVYHHHTVRAFENMTLIGLLHILDVGHAVSSLPGIRHPLDLLYHDDNSLLTCFSLSPDPFLKDLFWRITNRVHHRKVADFSPYDFTVLRGRRVKDTTSAIELVRLAKDRDARHEFQLKVLQDSGYGARDEVEKRFPFLRSLSPELYLDYLINVDLIQVRLSRVYVDRYILNEGFIDNPPELSLNDLGLRDPLETTVQDAASAYYGLRIYTLPEIRPDVESRVNSQLKQMLLAH